MKKLLCGAFLALAVLTAGVIAAKVEPKKISDIMDEAHKGGKDSLLAQVKSGKAEAADAKKLLGLYEDLGKNDPPKGTKADWKKKTDALVAAAKKVAAKTDDKAAIADLNKARGCAGCHKDHKP